MSSNGFAGSIQELLPGIRARREEIERGRRLPLEHAGWVLGGCVVMEDGSPRMTLGIPQIIHTFMPIGDVRVHDTWHASGLCGTGSNDFEAADVFVPEQRIVVVFDTASHRPEPLFRMPVLALFSAHCAAAGLGIARAAMDELTALAIEKTPSFSTVPMADKPVTQIEVARAEAALGGARAFLYDSLDDLWQTVAAGREPTKRQPSGSRCRGSSQYSNHLHVLRGLI